MKSRLGTALLVAAGILALAAIWIPAHWWQYGATAVLTAFTGAALLGQKPERPEKRTICLRCSADYPSDSEHYCPQRHHRDPYEPFDPPPTKPYRSSDGPAQNGAI